MTNRMNFEGVYGELTTLPGCSQVVVSHSVFTPSYRRGKGFGKKALAKRVEHASLELGYDYMLCTVRKDNITEQCVLGTQGFERLAVFRSSNTGHEICLFGKKLG